MLFLVGLVIVFMRQCRLWQGDRGRLAEIKAASALQALESWLRLPMVSALVAAWNEAQHIQAHIQSFINLRYPHKQLVLVAGGTDGTYELAQKFASDQVIVIKQIPGEGKQHALRRGLEYTDGEIIYLTDADCTLDEVSFETVLHPLAAWQEQVATGTSIPDKQRLNRPFIFSQAASMLYGAYHAPTHAAGLFGRNCMVTKEAILRSGGLMAEAPSGTDYVLAKHLARVGIAIRQVPASMVVSDFTVSLRSYYHQQTRWLRNVVVLGKQFAARDEVRAVWLNALIGLGMLLMPLLAVAFGPMVMVAWGLLILHGWLARIRYGIFTTTLLQMHINPCYWLYIPGYLLLDFSVWVVAIPRFFKQQKWW